MIGRGLEKEIAYRHDVMGEEGVRDQPGAIKEQFYLNLVES